MAVVEPVPDAPAAVAELPDERALVVADYHAGIEVGLRYQRGVELDSAAPERRERLLALLDRTNADRVVVLGDLAHRIAAPEGEEREEIAALIDAVTERVPLTLVVGNHDPGVAEAFAADLDVIPAGGERRGDVAFVHGHTWPDPAVFGAETVCMGHEHPQVRLEDAVGGSRTERAWLRGALRREPFEAEAESGEAVAAVWNDPELVVFPAFNERSGGTWINVDGQQFLAPFLPEGLVDGQAYLLDGTRLGAYRSV
ncbi:metallophosphoesterase [Haloparvum sedimenti]|uniref:metallophosphoesterase n=1 Tax=Haloparvum sedimenti TaxID=1678448 RepID=UPI00071E71D4|nr:metallophosphoesterase [Haloparvum sedimenti]